jgi:hypothetical protein
VHNYEGDGMCVKKDTLSKLPEKLPDCDADTTNGEDVCKPSNAETEWEQCLQKVYKKNGNSCPTCHYYGYQYTAEDIEYFPATEVKHGGACYEKCKDKEECKFWTFIEPNAEDSRRQLESDDEGDSTVTVTTTTAPGCHLKAEKGSLNDDNWRAVSGRDFCDCDQYDGDEKTAMNLVQAVCMRMTSASTKM